VASGRVGGRNGRGELDILRFAVYIRVSSPTVSGMTGDINIHPEVCHADNFPEWNETNNTERLPVIQYQPWADPGPIQERFGGYVLRMPPAFETQNLLNADNEKHAFEEAKVIAARYQR